MRRLIVAVALVIPLAAHAQAPQPITLTPEEYQTVLMSIAGRDPVLSLLMKKQNEAQERAAEERAKAAPPEPPKKP